jgi:TolB-like protein/Tfp pilus assembly protein PilF
MSPEQVRGEVIDARSDLFSFGAVLYEMAVGRRAFPGTSTETVCDAVLKGPPPLTDPEFVRLTGIADIVRRALEKDRTKRYQRAADLKMDLERLARAAEASAHIGGRRTALKLAAATALTALLALSGFQLAHNRSAPRPAPISRRSVAVLPFKPLVATSAGEDYLGLALAESLITELGAFKTVAVYPLSSSSRFGPGRDPIVAGRRLGADLVLDGAIQRAGDRLRVNVTLVRSADGLAVWTDRFESTWTDVFHLQDAITDQVGRALAAALPGEDRERVLRRRTHDVAAYEAYLKGRYFWNRRTPDDLQRALVYFQQAIDTDHEYASAYAGLADTYAMLGSSPYAVMPASDASAKAKAAAKRALEIDETLADAHVSLAFATYAYDWDWPAGEREFKRAIQLDPNYATAHYWYSLYLGQLGRVTEALAEAKRSRDLEPLSLIGNHSVALALYYARRYDEAADSLRKTLELDPNFQLAHRLLGQLYEAQGRSEEGLLEFQQLSTTARINWLHAGLLAHAYGRTGDRSKAWEIVNNMVEASKTRFVPSAQIAWGYIGLGDRDSTFVWLERAYGERSQALTFLKTDPMYDELRSDARYASLLRRVGLAP